MPLSPEEKAKRARKRMLDKAAEYQTGTYIRKFVAPTFQRMIRAEAAASEWPWAYAIVEGTFTKVRREIGQVVCVTCGKVCRWDTRSTHTGHFIAGRSNSILFEEDNVAPQCAHCNEHLSGAQGEYRKWMIAVRGIEAVEHLERLKQQSVSFSRHELVDMRIDYDARLKAAEKSMKGPSS